MSDVTLNCGNCAQVMAERIAMLEAEIEHLTPGGSEFTGDTSACLVWIKARLAMTAQIALQRNIARNGYAEAKRYEAQREEMFLARIAELEAQLLLFHPAEPQPQAQQLPLDTAHQS